MTFNDETKLLDGLTIFIFDCSRRVDDLHQRDDHERDVHDHRPQLFPTTPMPTQPQNVVEQTSQHYVDFSRQEEEDDDDDDAGERSNATLLLRAEWTNERTKVHW